MTGCDVKWITGVFQINFKTFDLTNHNERNSKEVVLFDDILGEDFSDDDIFDKNQLQRTNWSSYKLHWEQDQKNMKKNRNNYIVKAF